MSVQFRSYMTEGPDAKCYVFTDLCKGCGLCMEKCPKSAIEWSERTGIYGSPTVVMNEDCIGYKNCQIICPECAILIEKKKK